MIRDHATQVKFTGTGYRAHCTTCRPTWFGQTYQFFKYMGYGQAGALRKAEMLARDDAHRHRAEQRRKELVRQHKERNGGG